MQAAWFVGVDWGSQEHQVCVTDAGGKVLGERMFEHGGAGLSEMADWLLSFAAGAAGDVGVAIETPRGPVVESLMEHGIAVHSLNPKQLDRFRDRLSPSGREGRPSGRAGVGLGVAYRPALFSTAGADRPDHRGIARVVAAERGADPGARSFGESDAAAALVLLIRSSSTQLMAMSRRVPPRLWTWNVMPLSRMSRRASCVRRLSSCRPAAARASITVSQCGRSAPPASTISS